ncbi:unnamed protein product [Fraxinus pennsylvanica]|uniref:Uncharacterized protein n=1 Tax=Fraxinus pennsylvanica TaxID=56036 RepID=A0AAD1Z7Y5_9LAMI|nr:unnamed protein product [Fraxinus pennsylvanica]
MNLGDDDFDFHILGDPESLSDDLEPTNGSSPLHITTRSPTTTTLEPAPIIPPAANESQSGPTVEQSLVTPTSPHHLPSTRGTDRAALDAIDDPHMGRGFREKMIFQMLGIFFKWKLMQRFQSKTTKKTPADMEGEKNPVWNFPIETLEDRFIEVNLPLKELFDNGSSAQNMSYAIAGTPEGRLSISYRFGDRILVKKPSGWNEAPSGWLKALEILRMQLSLMTVMFSTISLIQMEE